jgi:hypothetical protein
MNQGTQGYSLTKKTEGRKSRDTVSLRRKALQHELHVLEKTKNDAKVQQNSESKF